MQTLETLIFLVKAVMKFRVSQISKILNTNTNRIFPISFKLKYISLRYTYFEKQFCSKQIRLLVRSVPNNFSQPILFLLKSITRNFMLNTMMENEKKRFASISIPFLILFVMKLIAQIKILFFPEIEGICLKYTNKRNNPLLSKSALKYLVYCQVFWIEVWRLQNQ